MQRKRSVRDNPCTMKTLRQLGNEETFLKIIRAIIPQPNIQHAIEWERLKAIFVISGTIQECPLSPLLFNTALEVLPRAIK